MQPHDSHHLKQLHDYINENRARGVADAHIRHTLVGGGWPTHMVDHALYGHHAAPQPQPVAPAPVAQHHAVTPSAQATSGNPKKYKVFPAIAEAWQAVRTNLSGFLLTFLLDIFLAGLSLVVMGLVLASLLHLVRGPDPSLGAAIFALITVFGMIFGWYVLAGSYLFTTLTIAANDGANHHKTSVSQILDRTWKVIGRVAATMLWSGLIVFGPVMAVFLLLIIRVAATGNISSVEAGAVFPLAVIVSFVWILLASVRLALVPYIAIFEPHIAPRATLKRSRLLLKKGGVWFVYKTIFLLIGVEVIVALITGTPVSEIGSSDNIFVRLFYVLMSGAMMVVFLMLYRNRHAHHG